MDVIDPETRTQILDVARASMQERGYSDLRYATISDALGITRAAVHYYYPTKVDLAQRVISDYREQMREKLRLIDESETSPGARLRRYVGLYREMIETNSDHICPGGMLAAEATTLPGELRAEVLAFFELNVDWVAKVLAGGRSEDVPGTSVSAALSLISTLQGALLVARLYRDVGKFDDAVAGLISRYDA